jgi:hypothetical protein
MSQVFEFQWERDRDGYHTKLMKSKEGETLLARREGYYLFANGGQAERYRPLDEYPVLFREFAEIPLTPDGVLAFANKYGFYDDLSTKDGVPIIRWYSAIKLMNHIVRLWKYNDEEELIDYFKRLDLGRASLKFEKSPRTGSLALYLEPKTLISAMWLQLVEVITSNVGIQKCARCTTWFRYGTGTGRRSTSQYCSDNCRKSAYKHRKKHNRIMAD